MTRAANRRPSARAMTALGGVAALLLVAACGEDGAEASEAGAGSGAAPPAAASPAVAATGESAGPALRTKAEVIEIGGGYCRVAERRVDQLPYPESDDPFGPDAPAGERAVAVRFLTETADALDFSRAGLASLDAPPQDRELLTSYVEGLVGIVADMRAAAAAAESDRAEAAFGAWEALSAKTEAYGFPAGTCGAGDDDGSESEGSGGGAADVGAATEEEQSAK